MPNRPVHIAVGVPAGIAFSLYKAQLENSQATLLEAIGGALGGFSGGVLPDLVDPPDGPNHRRIAHGIAPIAGLAYVATRNVEGIQRYFRTQASRYAILNQTSQSQALAAWYGLLEILMRIIAGAVAGFIAGYSSHVMLDFMTPRSLPLVG